MAEKPSVLIVDDEPDIRQVLVEALRVWGYEPVSVGDGREGLEALRHRLFDVALVDLSMPHMDGLTFLGEVKHLNLDVDVVMMTGRPSMRTAVQALKSGAHDYLQKPLELAELGHLLGRVMEDRLRRRELAELRSRIGERLPVQNLIGDSPRMREIRDIIERVASSDSPILIEGESGTGKELVAAAIHRRSPRATGPFVPVNCGAIPEGLMESQFFGHVRGAFSGAVSDAPGLFRSAHRGSLFLDEIGELPASLQVKLLRVLQDKEVRAVGAVKSQLVDVRVIAATNRRLEDAVRDGAFRQDLYYRLDIVRIVMPPLRERKEDIPRLVGHFIRQLNQRYGRSVSSIAPDALALLAAHDFPGNIRELENMLERAYAMGARAEIGAADLPPMRRSLSAPAPMPAARLDPPAGGDLPRLADLERDLIQRALVVYGNDRERAAKALGISRRTLYRRLADYRLL